MSYHDTSYSVFSFRSSFELSEELNGFAVKQRDAERTGCAVCMQKF